MDPYLNLTLKTDTTPFIITEYPNIQGQSFSQTSCTRKMLQIPWYIINIRVLIYRQTMGGITMKRISSKTVGLICMLAILITCTSAWGTGKIAPSRTLKGSGDEMGKLSVFSEPPGLEVTLDGSQIGPTPVREIDVKPGSHTLRVRESEAEIYITPGEPLNLSWRRGIFIVISSKEKTEPEQPRAEEKDKPQPKKAAQTQKNEPKLEPLYWPLNPRGPIF